MVICTPSVSSKNARHLADRPNVNMQSEHQGHIHDEQSPRLLTVKEVAARLGCSSNNVYALINQGLLPVIRVGRSKGYRVDSADLELFLRQRRVQYEVVKPTSAPRPRLRHLKL